MRKSRFTEEVIIAIPKEHEAGSPTAEVCRRHASRSQPSMGGSRDTAAWKLSMPSV
jgi:putative transposase